MPAARAALEDALKPGARAGEEPEPATRSRSQRMRMRLRAAAWLALWLATASATDPACPAPAVGVNVLYTGGVATVQVGDLPLLPPGTPQSSYGPFSSCNDLDGIIVVGGPSALDQDDRRFYKSREHRHALKMFADWVNGERGGLAVGGQRYGIRFHWIGDSSSSDWVTNATALAIRHLGADFVFPPYGSGPSEMVARQAFAEHKITMTWAASAARTHSCAA